MNIRPPGPSNCWLAVSAALALVSCSSPKSSETPAQIPAPKLAAKPKPPEPQGPVFTRPQAVKGIYLTAWTAGGANSLDRQLKLVSQTELNSVVIDVRDTGENYFPTKIPLSDEAEKNEYLAVPKPQKLMQKLSDAKVWPIARIACFRDNLVTKAFPERAIQLPNGHPWQDRSRHCWLDPYNKKNWQYIAQIVDYAMNIGFPEIQLDYVRFSSEGNSKNQVFPAKKSYEPKNSKPEDVVEAFATYISDRVRKRGRLISADIFGIISSTKGDEGIGQQLEKVAAPFDAISPMVYPSHFARGEYRIPNPNAAPYEIVYKSLNDFRKRLPKKEVRPWLQAFSLGIKYGGKEIRAQIKAANDAGCTEFLLWNAGNRYTSAGLKPKTGKLAAPEGQVEGSRERPPTDGPGKAVAAPNGASRTPHS